VIEKMSQNGFPAADSILDSTGVWFLNASSRIRLYIVPPGLLVESIENPVNGAIFSWVVRTG